MLIPSDLKKWLKMRMPNCVHSSAILSYIVALEEDVGCKIAEIARLENRIRQLESAQPKWISVIDNPPDEGDVVFMHDPDEGWIALVKVIRVNLASIDVKAIWPEHSPPFIAKVWTPLRLPEPPKEENNGEEKTQQQ